MLSGFIRKRFTEVFHYVSDKPPALFREELGLLLSGRGNKPRPNIAGRFVAENAFEARMNRELGLVSWRTDTRMYLYGEIVEAGDKTHVIVSLSNPAAPFALVPLVMGLVVVFAFINQQEYVRGLGAGLIIALGFPWIFLESGYYSKNRLRNQLVRGLGLEMAAG